MHLKLVMFTLLLMPICGFAKSAPSTAHLRDYILTADQIQKLPPKDQATYLTFLYHFVSVLETSQAKHQLKKKSSKKNALLDIFHDMRFDWDFLAEVHASTNQSFPIFGRDPEARQPNAAYMKALDQTATNYFAYVSASFESNFSVPGYNTEALMKPVSGRMPASGGEPMVAAAAAGTPPPDGGLVAAAAARRETPREGPQLEDPPRERPPGPPPTPVIDRAQPPPPPGALRTTGTGEETVAEFRAEGSPCLFGGHVSEYKLNSKGRLTCPAPRGTINSATCRGTRNAPKFKCNTFGMESGPAQQQLESTACIELRPLSDLTVRCTAQLTQWIQNSPPTSMDAAAYTAWREAMLGYLDKYETSFSSSLKFSEYCANENEVNDKKQARECKAIETLIAKLKELSPTASQAVATAGAAGAAASPTAAGALPATAGTRADGPVTTTLSPGETRVGSPHVMRREPPADPQAQRQAPPASTGSGRVRVQDAGDQ